MQAEGESLLTLPFNLGEVWRLFFPVNEYRGGTHSNQSLLL